MQTTKFNGSLLFDKTYIITTLDARDLFNNLGMQQAKIMMQLQVKFDITHPLRAGYHFFKLPYQLPAIERAIEDKTEKETFNYLYYEYMGIK